MGLLKLVKGKKEARSGRMPGKEDRGHPLKEEVNMKKLSALLLALCLLFSVAGKAFLQSLMISEASGSRSTISVWRCGCPTALKS